MGWATGTAVYLVIWWLVIFMVLPWGAMSVIDGVPEYAGWAFISKDAWIAWSGDQRRSQLESIGRAKGMDGEQPSGAPSHLLSGGNGVGMVEEKSQPSKGIIQYCAW